MEVGAPGLSGPLALRFVSVREMKSLEKDIGAERATVQHLKIMGNPVSERPRKKLSALHQSCVKAAGRIGVRGALVQKLAEVELGQDLECATTSHALSCSIAQNTILTFPIVKLWRLTLNATNLSVQETLKLENGVHGIAKANVLILDTNMTNSTFRAGIEPAKTTNTGPVPNQ